MQNQLVTHDDWNQLYIRSIKNFRKCRDFKTARRVLTWLRLMRKLQRKTKEV